MVRFVGDILLVLLAETVRALDKFIPHKKSARCRIRPASARIGSARWSDEKELRISSGVNVENFALHTESLFAWQANSRMLKPIASPSESRSQALTSLDAPLDAAEIVLILLSIKSPSLEYFLKELFPEMLFENQSISSVGKISRFPCKSLSV